jgi:proteic killer suppression protein
MIKSFNCKETEGIWAGKTSRKLPHDIQERAFRKLRQLSAARTIEDLKEPPSNNLEALKGNMSRYMSIRINKQWRLRFVWDGSDAENVEIIDYH